MNKRFWKSLRFFVVSGLMLLAACTDSKNNSNGNTGTPKGNYPEKADMIVMADRPPELETPLSIFKYDITPNNYFFVRWHLTNVLTKIDADTFRLRIQGTGHDLELSLKDLKTKFPVDSVVAIAVCSGNSRSTFSPRVPGIQWGNGAMGNARWKGVKLKYLLEAAQCPKDAVDVTFQGLDRAALPGVAPFVRAITYNHALDGEVLIAYEMNGEELPMLNGYPLKVVVPGWYAAYWVGALCTINVLKEKFTGFWMTKAYLATTNPKLSEHPDSLSKDMAPLTSIRLHSIFVSPEPGTHLKQNQTAKLEGLVINDGTPLAKVELSLDGGRSWQQASLTAKLGKYSWTRWTYNWSPAKNGSYELVVKATDVTGHTQQEKQWNRNGYGRDFMEHLQVIVD